MRLVLVSLKNGDIIEGELRNSKDEVRMFVPNSKQYGFSFLHFCVCKLFIERIDKSIRLKRESKMDSLHGLSEYGDNGVNFLLFSDIDKAKKVTNNLVLNILKNENLKKIETIKQEFMDTLNLVEQIEGRINSVTQL